MITVMMSTPTVHPPAGSKPVIVFLSKPAWNFVFYPTSVGLSLPVAVALVYNNATRSTKYPKYWQLQVPMKVEGWATVG
jgi:CBS-domain-containing membrane protein